MHFPKVPLHLQNPELAKSMYEGVKGGTDYKKPETVPSEETIIPQYRTPPDRVNGNVLFRRLPNGELDYGHAKNVVLDALNRAKYTGADSLNDAERAALSCLFPGSFDYVDSGLVTAASRVLCKLEKGEKERLAIMVAMHLGEEENWNAGFGGGSVPGRSVTKT